MVPTIQYRDFLENINQSKTRLDKAQEEISSGKIVNRLSDNPYAASQTSEIAAIASANDQFIANNDQLRSKLELTDSVLQLLNQTIDSAKVLAVQALSGTTTPESRQALATAVGGTKQQALSDANTKFNGAFLFAGTLNTIEPFIDSGGGTVTYQGNNESIFQRLDRSSVLKTNVTGQELFLDSPPIFSVLDDLKTAIQNNDVTTIRARLDDLELISNRVNDTDTNIGNDIQLLDQIQSRIKSQNLALQTQSSRLGDANLVESISKFELATQAVNTTLNAQAKIQQLSLIDFLR
jgi:flagellar hook-associated protein 3 FlgL